MNLIMEHGKDLGDIFSILAKEGFDFSAKYRGFELIQILANWLKWDKFLENLLAQISLNSLSRESGRLLDDLIGYKDIKSFKFILKSSVLVDDEVLFSMLINLTKESGYNVKMKEFEDNQKEFLNSKEYIENL